MLIDSFGLYEGNIDDRDSVCQQVEGGDLNFIWEMSGS